MQKIIITVIILIALVLGIGWYQGWFASTETVEPDQTTDTGTGDTTTDTDTDDGAMQDDTTDDDTAREPTEVIGTSASGNDIVAHHYGNGNDEILIVGGIHGGYGWNTVLLARELMGHFESNPDTIPENVTVTVIPLLNPDGLNEVVGTTGAFSASDVPAQSQTIQGRFNGNEVDLNRNFACDWQSDATWRDNPVDAGSEAFSEPEAQAIRDYVDRVDPTAAIVYYSAAGGVYASQCGEGILSETRTLMNTYASASGYPAHDAFEAYEVTGDMVDWFAKQNIPGISVILETHTDTEWSKNKAGIEAILEHYAQ